MLQQQQQQHACIILTLRTDGWSLQACQIKSAYSSFILRRQEAEEDAPCSFISFIPSPCPFVLGWKLKKKNIPHPRLGEWREERRKKYSEKWVKRRRSFWKKKKLAWCKHSNLGVYGQQFWIKSVYLSFLTPLWFKHLMDSVVWTYTETVTKKLVWHTKSGKNTIIKRKTI